MPRRNELTAEALHEWRKQVKYLLNAGMGLRPSGKDSVPKVLQRADRLAHQLGDIHDLVVLSKEVAHADRETLDSGARKTLQTLIADRDARLKKRAFRLGEKIYRRKPSRVVENLR